MIVIDKDISSKKRRSGQFMTPVDIVTFCLSKIKITSNIVIEPSCGEGGFLDFIRKNAPPECKIIGIELDSELASKYNGKEQVTICNFYDWGFPDFVGGGVVFIGNPPYRSPAAALKTHKDYIQQLLKKYSINGIKEESVFFIIKTVDLILTRNVRGTLHYILPKSIFQNNSSKYKSFISFLKKYTRLKQAWDIEKFPGVDQNLVFVSFEVNIPDANRVFIYNGNCVDVNEFYGNKTKYIMFHNIFKKTYLGSVPCESLFLSINGEPLDHFKNRLTRLFHPNTIISSNTLIELLSFNKKQHGRSIKKGNEDKIKKLVEYIRITKTLVGFDCRLFEDPENYKPIRHRNEDRFYFRHGFLKKASFVYILNSNPCPSFYFPGNPSSNSTDYFGFCEYDINRNSGPGANRTVPLENIENNLTDDFKRYWNKNTGGLPYEKVFSYIIFISKSEWYKNMKKTYHRFYFGLPEKFNFQVFP